MSAADPIRATLVVHIIAGSLGIVSGFIAQQR